MENNRNEDGGKRVHVYREGDFGPLSGGTPHAQHLDRVIWHASVAAFAAEQALVEYRTLREQVDPQDELDGLIGAQTALDAITAMIIMQERVARMLEKLNHMHGHCKEYAVVVTFELPLGPGDPGRNALDERVHQVIGQAAQAIGVVGAGFFDPALDFTE